MLELEEHKLDDEHSIFVGEMPLALRLSPTQFEELWALHPETFHEIKIHGKLVKTPRWQQAYGADYRYTGNVNKALPVPPSLEPLHAWARAQIDPRLDGLLLNWYDAERAQYIGKHRDSTVDMIEGAPIVTVSYGAERAFRLRPWKGEGFRDFIARAARSDHSIELDSFGWLCLELPDRNQVIELRDSHPTFPSTPRVDPRAP